MERDFKPVHTPLDLPLLIFWGAAIVATVLAIFGSSLAFKQSLGETRVVTSYLLFFVVTQLVRDKAQLVRLTKGFFIIAGVVALATIAQYALGDSQIIIAGRVGALWTEGQTYSDVARVIPPGQSVLVVAFIAVFATLMTERVQFRQARRFVMLGVLGLAILLTFFRASWGVIALTVLLAGLLAGGEEKRRFVSWVLLGMVALGVIVGMIMLQPQSPGAGLVRATFNRLSTLVEPATFQDPQSSLRWRDFEYAYALPHIYANPFIGLGMGALYRPLTPQDWENFDGRTFVHNGHIYILLKVGLFGYVASMWFILGVLVRGLRSWRRIADPYMRGIVLAFSLTSLVVLLVSMVEPYVVTTGWTPVIGTIAGINEVAIRIASRAEES